MKATFSHFTQGDNWVSGRVGRFVFEAKLFDVGSQFGIDGGRVSKLRIFEPREGRSITDFQGYIANYDRGWDIRPEGREAEEAFNAVMRLLENAPKLFG